MNTCQRLFLLQREPVRSIFFIHFFQSCRPSDSEFEYLVDVLYNGFYAFEALTDRDLDDTICGICGTVGEVYLGDGNEKNCCGLSEVRFFIDKYLIGRSKN